jgi:predicted nucleic acid-binding Zn ribbon protein
MDRAGRVLGQLQLASRGVTAEELAIGAWPAAVGKKIARKTRAIGLVRSRLVVEVEDAVWQKQLWVLRGQILSSLQNVLGNESVSQLEFRVAVKRRQPGREETHGAGVSGTDEADAIADPIFRNLYRAARRKAIR